MNGGEPRQLVEMMAREPVFSPDGSLIAFSSNREGPDRIYVMTAYGTDQRRLLVLAGKQNNPKWSMNHLNN